MSTADSDDSDSDYGCPTVRRFARSTSECFPDERAHCIERPTEHRITSLGHSLIYAAGLVGLCLFIAVMLARRFE